MRSGFCLRLLLNLWGLSGLSLHPWVTLHRALSSSPLLLVSAQVEQFKQDPSPTKCLHSVFNVDTGDEVLAYGDYHHLQVRWMMEP